MGHIVAALVFSAFYQLNEKTQVAAERIMIASAVLLFVGAAVALVFMKETLETPEASP